VQADFDDRSLVNCGVQIPPTVALGKYSYQVGKARKLLVAPQVAAKWLSSWSDELGNIVFYLKNPAGII
jgi:hypothetical protein